MNAPILKITTEQDAKDLIGDLKDAVKRSLRNGGCYSVVRKDEAGEEVLSVEVHLNGKAKV